MGQPRRRRRRRGRRSASGGSSAPQAQQQSATSYEEVVSGGPKQRPSELTAPPDGQTLEDVIGDLQSEWGVPQYPQEYRITLKVAGEGERAAVVEQEDRTDDQGTAPGETPTDPSVRRREKAPAAPRIGASGTSEQPRGREAAPRRKRRGRRRRGGGKSRPAS